MAIKGSWKRMVRSYSKKANYTILLIVTIEAKLDIGFFAASLISKPTLPLKIAVGGFAAGTLIFVFPLYYMAVMGRN